MRSSDIRFGRRLAWCGAWLMTGASIQAYVHQSPISYWPVGSVTWQFHLMTPAGSPTPSAGSPLLDGSTSWDEAVDAAFDAWNAVLPDSILVMVANKNSGVSPGSANGVNNVAFTDTVYGTDWGSSTVGMSITWWSGQTRIENDVLFNANKTWNAYTGSLKSSNDIRRVAMHEFGHSLGLNHPDQDGQSVEAVMNSIISHTDDLTQDDVDGVLSLYGAIEPVAITSHPQSFTTPEGGDWQLSVTATGSPPLSYDWERSTDGGATWSDIPGIGSSVTAFTYPNVNASQDGWRIRAHVSNSEGPVTSNVATLTVTVNVAPSITLNPQSTTVNDGGLASFSVSANGTPTPSIQWQRSTDGGSSWSNLTDGGGITGATTTDMQINPVTLSMSGHQFRAVASNSAGSANSTAANLGVAAAPPQAPTNPNRTDTSATGFTAMWDGILNALGYRIDVATDAAFTSFAPGYQDLDIGNVTSVDVSGLTSGTYYYRVRAYNAEGTSTNSEALLVGIGGRVSNLSTRGRTGDGAETLIIGFVIKGTANKPLLIRASGPSLSVLGLNDGTVPNPRLALFQQNGTPILPGNDDWDHTDAALQSAISSVFAFPFLEPSVDAAMLVDLPPGIYTVHAQTVTGEAGITSVELYELDDTGELINVSTRAYVGQGAEVLIPGSFLGTAPKRVLVRAVGETLADLGVTGVLDDPVLEVVPLGAATPIYSSDDWGSAGDEAAIVAASTEVFAFPLPSGSRDAAILADLPTGGFTFVVRGKDGATGIVLVELYVVP